MKTDEPVDLETRAHERDHHHKLAQAFHQDGVLQRMNREGSQLGHRKQSRTKGDAENRQRQRHLSQDHRNPGGHQNNGA